jgi:hypothetical protein
MTSLSQKLLCPDHGLTEEECNQATALRHMQSSKTGEVLPRGFPVQVRQQRHVSSETYIDRGFPPLRE